jgi:hypothetical protein
MSSVDSAATAALKVRKASATDARAVAEGELKAIGEQLAATTDAAETTRLNNRKAEVQARLDAQATIEEETTGLLEKAELHDAGTVKEPVSIRRSTFDAMTPAQRLAHAKDGGIVTDPPAKIVKPQIPVPPGGMRRADFERLTPTAQLAHAQTGGPIVD